MTLSNTSNNGTLLVPPVLDPGGFFSTPTSNTAPWLTPPNPMTVPPPPPRFPSIPPADPGGLVPFVWNGILPTLLPGTISKPAKPPTVTPPADTPPGNVPPANPPAAPPVATAPPTVALPPIPVNPPMTPADVQPDTTLLGRLVDAYNTTLGQTTSYAGASSPYGTGSTILPATSADTTAAPAASSTNWGSMIAWLIILGVLGGGGYFGWKWYKKHHAAK